MEKTMNFKTWVDAERRVKIQKKQIHSRNQMIRELKALLRDVDAFLEVPTVWAVEGGGACLEVPHELAARIKKAIGAES